ncbi:MAG: hypothetical protein GTO63_18610 [Anaerolineae bacterium]|nr:hypothetical protein [Anaerolineae bacterium]NIN96782.1 hypothetical protein [Anaerolineae bacterium]NIQ79778.1 hypothetical protein [Anaerolineae bacterium]
MNRRNLRSVTRLLAQLPGAVWLSLTLSQRKYHLFVVAVVLYLATNPLLAPGLISSLDVVPTTLLPVSIIRERDFDLDEFLDHPVAREHDWERANWLVKIDDHYFSGYPVFTALLVTPLYLLPVVLGLGPQSSLVAYTLLGKTGGALLAAASVVLVYLSLRLAASELTALCLSVVYAFASSTWTISSQILWQHATSQLLLAAGIYCLIRSQGEAKTYALSGLFIGLAVAARPPTAIVAVVLTVYVLHRSRGRFPHFVAGALGSLAFLLWYNHSTFGSPIAQGYEAEAWAGWTTPLLIGLVGLLLSPSRGLLVYSPVFWFSIAGIAASWTKGLRDNPHIWLFRYLGVAVAGFTFLMSKWHSPGGWCFGPRMLVDVAPLLTLLMIPAFKWLGRGRIVLVAFGVLLAISIAVQLAGLTMFDFSRYRQLPAARYEQPAFWSIRHSELAFYLDRFGVGGFLGRILGQAAVSATLALFVTGASLYLLRRRGLLEQHGEETEHLREKPV